MKADSPFRRLEWRIGGGAREHGRPLGESSGVADDGPDRADPVANGSSGGDRAESPSPGGAEAREGPAATASERLETVVERGFGELRSLIVERVGRNERLTKAFDALHDDLQGYKNAFLLDQLHKPVIRDLLGLYDSFLRLEEGLRSLESGQPGDMGADGAARDGLAHHAQNMENFRFKLLETLARLDVEPYDARHDVPKQESLRQLDRKLHRPVRVKETSDSARHNEVIQTLRQGFYWKDRVFRPEEVVVARRRPEEKPGGGVDDGQGDRHRLGDDLLDSGVGQRARETGNSPER